MTFELPFQDMILLKNTHKYIKSFLMFFHNKTWINPYSNVQRDSKFLIIIFLVDTVDVLSKTWKNVTFYPFQSLNWHIIFHIKCQIFNISNKNIFPEMSFNVYFWQQLKSKQKQHQKLKKNKNLRWYWALQIQESSRSG